MKIKKLLSLLLSAALLMTPLAACGSGHLFPCSLQTRGNRTDGATHREH